MGERTQAPFTVHGPTAVKDCCGGGVGEGSGDSGAEGGGVVGGGAEGGGDVGGGAEGGGDVGSGDVGSDAEGGGVRGGGGVGSGGCGGVEGGGDVGGGVVGGGDVGSGDVGGGGGGGGGDVGGGAEGGGVRGVIPINSLMASNFAAWRFSIASSSAEHSQVDGTLPLPLLLPLQMLRSLTRRSMLRIRTLTITAASGATSGRV